MGGFFRNSEANKSIKTFPDRWALIESSIAEALGVPMDTVFSGKQCLSISEKGAAGGVLELGHNAKHAIDRLPLYTNNDKNYKIPKTDSSGILPAAVLPAVIDLGATTKATYCSNETSQPSVPIGYGLHRVPLALAAGTGAVAEYNFLAQDPETGVTSLYLPPGLYYLYFAISQRASVQYVPASGTTTLDLWITPFMPMTGISPPLPVSVKTVATVGMVFNSVPVAHGNNIHSLCYVLNTPSPQYVHINIGRLTTTSGDPPITKAGFSGFVNILKVG